MQHGKKLLVAGAVIALISAGFYGQLSRGLSGYERFLPGVIPGAKTFTVLQTSADTILYDAKDNSGKTLGLITGATSPGYGGPMTVMVGWTASGVITSVTVPQHHEDLPWWKVLGKTGFFKQYIGRSYSEPLQISSDVDAATGSTVSSNGVAIGVRSGRFVLADYLGNPYTGPAEPIQIGLPDIGLFLGLFAVVLARTLPKLRKHSWPRVLTLTYGFVVVGLWLSVPLSLTNIASWLVGYSPHIQTFFIIYVMVFGVIGLAVILGKNYYCFWLCPYVAVQELFHLAFGASVHPNPKLFKILHNTRYVLLFVALFLVLALKTPSVSVFEPWNVLFSLRGTADQWVLMIFALTASMFIYNFWCHYLCPVGAVMEIVLKVRKGLLGIWPKRKMTKNPEPLQTS
ncbi:FMN-binding protein [Dehalogenimonas etheniformans]|uniref:FMN-binding protein n=1 Tax=Dehalogenimonas etheniformans TaxID=1536648 RepID=A0A2P5P5I1_9CHLR|nr:FMN-binding protein [Dehalogenimonas etheniformans]